MVPPSSDADPTNRYANHPSMTKITSALISRQNSMRPPRTARVPRLGIHSGFKTNAFAAVNTQKTRIANKTQPSPQFSNPIYKFRLGPRNPGHPVVNSVDFVKSARFFGDPENQGHPIVNAETCKRGSLHRRGASTQLVNEIHNQIVKQQRLQGCGVTEIEADVHEIRALIQDYFDSFNPHRWWWQGNGLEEN
jgi:hypothetical protein